MIQAVETVPAANLPDSIKEALALHGLSGSLQTGQADLPAQQRVQAALLEDDLGTLLVLFSQDRLLDLARLNEITGRRLQGVAPQALQRTLARHRLQALPGLPLPNDSPCLYEASLTHHDRLWLAPGNPDLLLQLSGAEFAQLLDKASAAHFSVPLAQIHPNLDRPDEDTAQITQAVKAFTARRIRQRLEETLEIPPLPHTASRIVKLRMDPNATADDIADVVETDPALAAQVVSWAASPYYAYPGKIRSVEDAIIKVLGFDLVLNLALGLALGKTLGLPRDEPQHATPYWHQAVYTAAVVDGLLRAMPRAQRPEAGLAYLGGLLHNFGYLVLAHVFPPHFSLFCRHRDLNPHLHHSYIEHHLLGITREQVGSWMLGAWGMPEEVGVALRFQHDPDYQGEHAAYANLVCLAVRLLGSRGIGSDPLQAIPPGLYARLGLTAEQAGDVLDKVLAAEQALRNLAGTLQPRSN